MSAPSVSVLIPSYNCARYLPETIESVLAQNFRDFDLVLLDDRSSDSSNEVLERFVLAPTDQWFWMHRRWKLG